MSANREFVICWVFGILGMIALGVVILYFCLMIGAFVLVVFAEILDAALVSIAFVLGGLTGIAALMCAGYFYLALFHPLNNWIHDRIDVLVID